MQEKMMALWAKVIEHKAVLIKTGSAVAGAFLGVIVASVIASNQEQISMESPPVVIEE